MHMEIILVGLSEFNFSPYVLLCKLAEFFYLLFKLLAFGRLPSGIIEDMEIAFCGIIFIKRWWNCLTVDFVSTYVAAPFGFKSSCVLQHKRWNEGLASFYHHDERIAVFIKISDIFLAEIDSVKDESDFLISKGSHPVDHECKLWYICYRTRIFLIEQRDTVCLVHGYGQIKYRKSLVIFCFADLYEFDITCLTVPVGRVIWDIYEAFVVLILIPVIQESYYLISCYRIQQTAYLWITVDFHLLGEQRMVKSKVRVILAGILFIYDKISHKVKQKSCILTELFCDHWLQFILIDNLLNDYIWTDLKAAASVVICGRMGFNWYLPDLHSVQAIGVTG